MNCRLVVIAALLAGCSVSGQPTLLDSPGPGRRPAPSAEDDLNPRRLLAEAETMIRAQNYRGAAEVSTLAFDAASTSDEAGGALWTLGRLSAAPENPDRDEHQAYLYFDRLVRQYPESQWAGDARAWRELLAGLLGQREELAAAQSQNDRLRKQARDARLELDSVRQDLTTTRRENDRLRKQAREARLEVESLRRNLERLRQVELEFENSTRP